MTIAFFKVLPRYFWSQISSFLVVHKALRFDKFESADFKYDINFLKLLPKHLIEAVLVTDFKNF